MVHYKIVSIDGIMFGYAILTAYEIKIVIVGSTDLCSLIGYSKRYRNDKLGDSLNIIDWRWNCTRQYFSLIDVMPFLQ